MHKVDLNGDGQLSPEEISKFTTETGTYSFILIIYLRLTPKKKN